jgi:hypothetical protein
LHFSSPPNSSVGIVTRILTGQQRNRGSFSAGLRSLFSPKIQTVSEVHPAFYTKLIGGFFPGVIMVGE